MSQRTTQSCGSDDISTVDESANPSPDRIKIRYEDSEVGFAERLEDDVVQINNLPLFAFGDLSQWDIVRIDEAGDSDYPVIKDILEIRLPCRPILSFDDTGQLDAVRDKLTPSGAQLLVLLEPKDGKPGLLTIVRSGEISLQFRERDPECCDLPDDDDFDLDAEPNLECCDSLDDEEEPSLEEWRDVLTRAALGTATDAINWNDESEDS